MKLRRLALALVAGALAAIGAGAVASGPATRGTPGTLVIAQFPARGSGFDEAGRIVLVSPSGRVRPLTAEFGALQKAVRTSRVSQVPRTALGLF